MEAIRANNVIQEENSLAEGCSRPDESPLSACPLHGSVWLQRRVADQDVKQSIAAHQGDGGTDLALREDQAVGRQAAHFQQSINQPLLSRREIFGFAIARKLLERFEGTPLEMDMKSVLGKIADSLEGTVSLGIESPAKQFDARYDHRPAWKNP